MPMKFVELQLNNFHQRGGRCPEQISPFEAGILIRALYGLTDNVPKQEQNA